jgi:hypothetical protein
MSLAKATQRMTRALCELHAGIAPRPSVFISYDRDDRALALRLRDLLASHGYAPWWDDNIGVGHVFEPKILEALEAAKAAAVIWTGHSVSSSWVRFEATQALKRGKLVPLAAPGLDLADIRPPFNGLNTLPLGDEAGLLEALERTALRN